MTGNRLSFDIEADEFDIFLDEVNEHLQAMEDGILRLERGADRNTLNSVFRAAHTLKALAGTVGHHAMAELTHTVETLFDAMREAQLLPTQAVVDELLIAVDTLKALRDEFLSLEPSGVDSDSILARLRALTASDAGHRAARNVSTPQLTPDQAARAKDYCEKGYAVLEIQAIASTDAFAPAARLSQAAMALMEVGHVIVQYPSMADLANNQHSDPLWLVLATQIEISTIEKVLDGVSDLSEFNVRPYPLDVKPMPAATPANAPLNSEQVTDKTVRISVERLDVLMNLVGELVTDRNRLAQVQDTLHAHYGKEETIGQLGEMAAHLDRVVDQLQEEVMRARMLPIAHLFSKFPRLVRDVARIAHKDVNLVIEGEATELDRSVIEVISDPLVHLLRNAVDHGIESSEVRMAAGKPRTGTVWLTAVHQEGQIVITVEDDGQGIDPAQVRRAALSRGLISEEEAAQLTDDEAIDLIFQPGLSTAERITEVSGRGVGMDVVRANIERLSGSIVVDSKVGQGTAFRVTLPLTLAIVETMLVALKDGVYAIPMSSIIDSLYLSDVTVHTVKARPTIRWRDTVLPLLDLRQFFAHPGTVENPHHSAKPAIVTVAWGKQQLGLVVDKIIGKQGAVVKSLSPIIGEVPGLSGGTILGDGRIALIVDTPGLIHATLQRTGPQQLCTCPEMT